MRPVYMMSVAAMAMLTLAACGGKKDEHAAKPAEAAPVAVQLSAVEKSEWAATYEAVGTVRARTTGVVAAKVMGYVRDVKAQVGSQVAAGQTLIEIETKDLDAQVRQAEAARNHAQSAEQEVVNAIAQAKVNLDLAQVTFKRMEDLFQKKSISNQEFDEAQARFKAAQAGYEMAQSRRRQVQAQIQQAEEGVRAARIATGYAHVAAPFAGVVVERKVEPGNLATPGAPLLVIEQAGAYRLEAPVEESKRALVRLGSPVSVAFEALGKTLAGRVSEIVPSVDAASRTVTVKIDLPGGAGMQSGLYGRAVFALGEKKQGILIPQAAVSQQGQLASVMVADGGVARTRLVTLGTVSGDRVEVLSGLEAGEKIVCPRPANLVDGGRVEARP